MIAEQAATRGRAMSEEQSTNAPLKRIKAQQKAWSQKQLLQQIVSRYFDVLEELGDMWPSWLVRARIESEEIENPHDALMELNQHLNELDWLARLSRDEPWKVTIFPSPPSLFTLGNDHRLYFWLAALFSTWIMGIVWLLPLHEGSKWTDPDIIRAGLLSYAFPLMAVLGLADYVHRTVAAKLEVRVGGLLPLALPIPYPGWPFALFAIPNHPRMESMPWADRRRLGWVSLAAPVTILFCGMGLVILGLWLTPLDRTIGAQPNRLTFGLLPQLIASFMWDPAVLSLKSAWVHPIALAGHGLMLVAWISLLPIPTFPGGRIIVAMSGMESARSQGVQILLFISLLSLGFLLGAFTGHVIWTFIVIAGGVLIASQGGDDRIPVILDDIRPLDEDSGRRLSMIFVISLLLMMPAEMPTLEDEEWDSELVWKWPAEVQLSDFNSSDGFSITVSNPGLLTRDWQISASSEGDVENWNLSWACGDDTTALEQGCDGQLSAEEKKVVHLEWLTPALPDSPSPLVISIENGDDEREVQIRPDFEIALIQPFWQFSGDQQSPVLCTTLEVSKDSNSFNITLGSETGDSNSATLWSISAPLDTSVVSNGSKFTVPVCIEGEAGSMQTEYESLRLQVVTDDGKMQSWALGGPTQTSTFILPAGGWHFGDDGSSGLNWTNSSEWYISGAMGWQHGDNLMVSEDLDCNSGGTWRQASVSEDGWRWESDLQKRVDWPNLSAGNLTWTGSVGGLLHHCAENSTSWELVDGPQVIMMESGVPRMDWVSKGWAIDSSEGGSLELSFQHMEASLSFDERDHGNGTGWLQHDIINDGIEVTLILNWQASDDTLVAWLELNDGQVQLHLAAWDLG